MISCSGGIGAVTPRALPASVRGVHEAVRARLRRLDVDLGLRVIFDGLVLVTALARGRGLDDRDASELRGFEGAVAFELTGSGGGTWHLVVAGATARFHRGPHPAPRATVQMSVDDFFRLLVGKTSYVVAGMSGRVRVRGEAHAGLMAGALIGFLRSGRRRPGRAGRAARAWTDLAVALSPTGHRFEESQGNGQGT
jgi:putative sterol carrier protein